MAEQTWVMLIGLLLLFEHGRSEKVYVSVLLPMSDARLVKEEECSGDQSFFPCDEEKDDGARCLFVDGGFHALAASGFAAVEDFNNRNGRFVKEFAELGNCDKQIVPSFLDSGYSPSFTIKQVLKQITGSEPQLNAVVGPATSSSSLPSALILGARRIPQISYWATSANLDNTEQYPYFMRTISTDDVIANMTCALWADFGFRFASIIYVNDDYGKAYQESIVAHCAARGIRVASYSFIAGGNEIEGQIIANVRKMKQSNGNVFLFVTINSGFELVMKHCFEQGLLGAGKLWFFSDGISTSKFENLDQQTAAAISGSLRIVQAGGVDDNQHWKNFEEAWPQFNVSRLNEQLPTYWHVRDNFFKNETSPQHILVRDVGTYMFDAVAAFGLYACQIAPTGPLPSDFGEKVLQLKSEFSFDGLSGAIRFDAKGNRDSNTANYRISNIILVPAGAGMKSHVVETGSFNQTTASWSFFSDTILFTGDSTQLVLDVDPPAHDMQLSSAVNAIAWLMFTINLSFGFGLLIWIHRNKKSPVVRASQVTFLFIIIFGCLVSTLAIPFLLVDDGALDPSVYDYDKDIALDGEEGLNIFCNLASWLVFVGFSLTHGSLAVKIYRIRKIFSTTALKVVNIPTHNLLSVVLLCTLIDVLILWCWADTDPLQYKRHVLERNPFGFVTRSAGGCESSSALSFLFTLAVFHIGLLLVANYLGFLTRHFHTAFSEGKYLFLAVLCTFQLCALGIPVLFISENPVFNKFFRCFLVFVSSFSVLSLVFIPKIVSVARGEGKSGMQSLVISSLARVSPSPNSRGMLPVESFHTVRSGVLKPSSLESSAYF